MGRGKCRTLRLKSNSLTGLQQALLRCERCSRPGITAATDPWLESITSEKLQEFFIKKDGTKLQRNYGSLLQRMIYHYWYHIGENLAVRQMLGHTNLPQFVGNIDRQAPYTPE